MLSFLKKAATATDVSSLKIRVGVYRGGDPPSVLQPFSNFLFPTTNRCFLAKQPTFAVSLGNWNISYVETGTVVLHNKMTYTNRADGVYEVQESGLEFKHNTQDRGDQPSTPEEFLGDFRYVRWEANVLSCRFLMSSDKTNNILVSVAISNCAYWNAPRNRNWSWNSITLMFPL